MAATQKPSTSNAYATLTLADFDQLTLLIAQTDDLARMAGNYADGGCSPMQTALALISERCEQQRKVLEAVQDRARN